jgi:hypothetical protein
MSAHVAGRDHLSPFCPGPDGPSVLGSTLPNQLVISAPHGPEKRLFQGL